MSDLILHTSEDGKIRLNLRVDGATIWLTQLEISELFQTTKNNVSLHTKNIFKEGELTPEATVKDSLTVQTEGGREVKRRIQFYNLDLILAIGYRVRSPRGTQFLQWATAHLKEYLVKGFVMDDERLKNPGQWDYFDELLARIREIRWNLCDAPGTDGGKVEAVKKFLDAGNADVPVGSGAVAEKRKADGNVGAPGLPRALVCTHATSRFAVEKFGVEVCDERLIAVDEFPHLSANPDNRIGDHVRQLMARDKAHLVAMTVRISVATSRR